MKRALVLCGTIPHILLIEKLKNRGYYVLLADMNSDAPAVPHADEFIEESAFDKELMLKIAKDKDVDIVISSCSEQANSVCCYVGEKLNLPHPYSYEISLDVTDKGRMKTLFKEGQVNTSDFMIFDNVEQLMSCNLQYPLVVKPVDAYSSKGVRKVDNPEQLIKFGKLSLEISRAGRGIVEEYCYGKELQIDCVAIGGIANVLMTRSKRTMPQDSIELNSCGSVVPADITEDEYEQAEEIAQRIVNAFGLKNTPFFYQARLNNGEIKVLEFAPRIGGGLSFQMIRRATGIDIVDVSIKSFLGERITLDERNNKTGNIATLLLYMNPGVFGSVTGIDEMKIDGIIDYATILKKRGDIVGENRTSSNRAVTMIISAESREELNKKTTEALNRIDILDIDGNSKLVRR